MSFPSRCAVVRADPLIPIEQNRRKFCLRNPDRKKIFVIKVDGCAVTVGERCDGMMHLSSGREVYIELKGAEIKKAVSQISSTIEKMSRVTNRNDRVGVVVSSRVPKEDTATQIAKYKLLRLVASIKIKNIELVATEDELFA